MQGRVGLTTMVGGSETSGALDWPARRPGPTCSWELAAAVPGKTLLSLFPEQSVSRRRVSAGKPNPPLPPRYNPPPPARARTCISGSWTAWERTSVQANSESLSDSSSSSRLLVVLACAPTCRRTAKCTSCQVRTKQVIFRQHQPSLLSSVFLQAIPGNLRRKTI